MVDTALRDPFYIVVGDELPKFGPYVLKYPSGQTINLTGKAVKFRFRRKAGGTGQERNATVVDATGGKAEYKFVDGDGLATGHYWAKFLVEDSAGNWISVPNPEEQIYVSEDRTATAPGPVEEITGFTLGVGRSLTERRANLARLQQLIADAGTNGTKLVELPAGTIEIELQAGDINSSVLGDIVCLEELTGTLTIRGAGRNATTVSVFPKSADALLYSGFIINAASVASVMTFEGFTLDGPSSFYTSAATVSEGIGLYSSGGLAGTSFVIARDVAITGRWNSALNITAAGKKRVLLEDVYGEGNIPIQCYYDTPTTQGGSSLQMWRTHLKSSLSPAIANAYNMYVHPSVSLRAVDCRFEDATGTVGYAVHIFGSPDTLPDYCDFVGCEFVNCMRGVLCSKLIATRITNCSFLVDSNAIVPQSAGTLKGFAFCENCRFKLKSGVNNLGGGVIGAYFRGCVFDDGGNTGTNLWDITGGTWQFRDCRFDRTSSGAFHIGVASAEVEIDGCEFTAASASYAVVPTTGAKVRMRDCIFGTNVRGSYGGAAATDVDLEGCQFKNTQAVRFSANNPSGQVRGRNNLIDSTTWTADGGSTGWCNFDVRQAANPNTVASASSVTLSPNYNQHHITGSTTINNFYVLDSAPTVDLFGAADIFLIADGAWALSNSGNIVPDHTGARTVGEMIHIRRDPTAAKWRVVK